jgi:hypothetical protein
MKAVVVAPPPHPVFDMCVLPRGIVSPETHTLADHDNNPTKKGERNARENDEIRDNSVTQ